MSDFILQLVRQKRAKSKVHLALPNAMSIVTLTYL